MFRSHTKLGTAKFHQFVSGHRFKGASHDFVHAESLPHESDELKIGDGQKWNSFENVEPKRNKEEASAGAGGKKHKTVHDKGQGESKDNFDSPMDALVVEIRLKHKWENHSFGRGFAKDRKAVAKIKDILSKKEIKKEIKNWPQIALRKWQDKQFKKEWKSTREGKPPQLRMTKANLKKWQNQQIREEAKSDGASVQFKKSDPIVMKWREREPTSSDTLIKKWREAKPDVSKPDALEPAPEYIPEEDNVFMVNEITDALMSIYVEDANNSGNFEMKHKAEIAVKYVEWRFVDVLEEAPSGESVRFQAALQCLHTFGGGNVFTNDPESCKWLSKKDKELDKKLVPIQAKSGQESDEYQTIKKESWDIYEPPLVFDPEFQELSDEALEQMDPSALDEYMRDTANERQLKILTWSRYAAIKQLPKNTVLEINFEGDHVWYRVKVIKSSTKTEKVWYKYLNSMEDSRDWSDGDLDLVADTFRIVKDLDEDGAAGSSDSDSSSDSSSDEEDDTSDYKGKTVTLADGTSGDITDVRQRVPVDIDNPYEYKVNDVWHKNIYTNETDLLDYGKGDTVRCPDGKERTIESTDHATAYFADGYSVSLNELDAVGESNASSDDETQEEEFDYHIVHTYQGRDVEILGKVYTKKGVGTDDEFEMVKVKFIDGEEEVVSDVPLENIDIEEKEEQDSGSDVDEKDLEAMDEQEEDDALSSDEPDDDAGDESTDPDDETHDSQMDDHLLEDGESEDGESEDGESDSREEPEDNIETDEDVEMEVN